MNETKNNNNNILERKKSNSDGLYCRVERKRERSREREL